MYQPKYNNKINVTALFFYSIEINLVQEESWSEFPLTNTTVRPDKSILDPLGTFWISRVCDIASG